MRRDALVQLFVAPLPLFAVALLAINDHLLKGSGLVPALVTGKLSDFAGLFFFPLFLAGLVSWRWAPPVHLERTLVAVCAVLTVFAFAAIKAWAPADDLYERVLGALRGVSRVSNVRDATDLVALPMAALAVVYAHLRLRAVGRSEGASQ